MGNLNFSKINTENKNEIEKISLDDIEVIGTGNSQPVKVPTPSTGDQISQIITSVADPLLGVVNAVINVIPAVMDSIARITESRQQTKRVEAVANAKIIESKEQTKRVQITEEEQTKRVLAGLKADLEKDNNQLTRMKMELEASLESKQITHEERMKQIETVSDAVLQVSKGYDLLLKCMNDGGFDATALQGQGEILVSLVGKLADIKV